MFREGKHATQKKTKVIIPDIGSHISLKPVFFVSFAPIVMFVRGKKKHVVVDRFVVQCVNETKQSLEKNKKNILHTLSLMTLIC